MCSVDGYIFMDDENLWGGNNFKSTHIQTQSSALKKWQQKLMKDKHRHAWPTPQSKGRKTFIWLYFTLLLCSV